MKSILRYLKGTLSHGILLQPSSSLALQGYTDTDWASCPNDRRSTSGYCVYLGSSLVSWSSSQQRVVSRSNAESEYRAPASLTVEIVWIQGLLRELGISQLTPPLIWCDNRSVAALAANPVFHARSKHIEIDLHFIRDKVLQGDLKIQYIPIAQQVADVFTKHLSSAQFLLFRTQLSIVPRLVHLWGDDNSSHSQLKEVTHNISLKLLCFFFVSINFVSLVSSSFIQSMR